jgi:hypothetical protein
MWSQMTAFLGSSPPGTEYVAEMIAFGPKPFDAQPGIRQNLWFLCGSKYRLHAGQRTWRRVQPSDTALLPPTPFFLSSGKFMPLLMNKTAHASQQTVSPCLVVIVAPHHLHGAFLAGSVNVVHLPIDVIAG